MSQVEEIARSKASGSNPEVSWGQQGGRTGNGRLLGGRIQVTHGGWMMQSHRQKAEFYPE